MPDYQGKFIVFEGGEGTGKTTQIQLLADKLKQNGFNVYLTREPGGMGCPIAEKIRALLKDPENRDMTPETELFLFLASRAQHVKKVIIPHLERGDIVVCDRFFGSTFAYQHFGRGLFNLDEVKKINDFAIHGLEPDLTILLDLPPEEGLKRIESEIKKDRFDSEKLEFHKKVRTGYLTLAKIKPNWTLIDARGTINDIHDKIWNATVELLDL
jgi:dTMP kinase